MSMLDVLHVKACAVENTVVLSAKISSISFVRVHHISVVTKGRTKACDQGEKCADHNKSILSVCVHACVCVLERKSHVDILSVTCCLSQCRTLIIYLKDL